MDLHNSSPILKNVIWPLVAVIAVLHINNSSTLEWLRLGIRTNTDPIPCNKFFNERSCERLVNFSQDRLFKLGRWTPATKECKKDPEAFCRVLYAAATSATTACNSIFRLNRWNCSSINLAPYFENDINFSTKERAKVTALAGMRLFNAILWFCYNFYETTKGNRTDKYWYTRNIGVEFCACKSRTLQGERGMKFKNFRQPKQKELTCDLVRLAKRKTKHILGFVKPKDNSFKGSYMNNTKWQLDMSNYMLGIRFMLKHSCIVEKVRRLITQDNKRFATIEKCTRTDSEDGYTNRYQLYAKFRNIESANVSVTNGNITYLHDKPKNLHLVHTLTSSDYCSLVNYRTCNPDASSYLPNQCKEFCCGVWYRQCVRRYVQKDGKRGKCQQYTGYCGV